MFAFAEISLTPSHFEALQPHDKTLLAMLLQERGQPVAPHIARHASARHSFRLDAMQDDPLDMDDQAPRLLPEKRKFPRLGRNILKAILMAENGVLIMSRAEMALHFSASVHAIERVMNDMSDEGLIRRARNCDWSLTESGRATLERLQPANGAA